jgi:ParB-like chromosome segregation protein Spo0J
MPNDCKKKKRLELGSAAIEFIAPDQLRPSARNPRTHSKKQLRQIGKSFRKFGFTNPVLIDEANNILAGHGRVEAAKLGRLDVVPCRRVIGLSENDKRELLIADNKHALNAGWDEEILAEELKYLTSPELSFDLDEMGGRWARARQRARRSGRDRCS